MASARSFFLVRVVNTEFPMYYTVSFDISLALSARALAANIAHAQPAPRAAKTPLARPRRSGRSRLKVLDESLFKQPESDSEAVNFNFKSYDFIS